MRTNYVGEKLYILIKFYMVAPVVLIYMLIVLMSILYVAYVEVYFTDRSNNNKIVDYETLFILFCF